LTTTSRAGNVGNTTENSPFVAASGNPNFSDVGRESGSGSEGATESEDSGGSGPLDTKGRVMGCLSLLESLKLHTSLPHTTDSHHANSSNVPRQRSRKSSHDKPDAGSTLKRRDMGVSAADAEECWEEIEGTHFQIRGETYMKTKAKVPSAKSIYKLVGADMFTFDKKQNHIAKLVHLPSPPDLKTKLSPEAQAHFPPLLIINLQLPTYAPSLFGGTDGHGWSIVYYFALREDFDPATFPNQKALGLLKRFVQNGREADGSPTRDRFKVIPRVVNVDQWATAAPLTSTEYRLLSNYNEKPFMSRPQHLFFNGPNYLEVDLDIHTYTYLARNALTSFISRLKTVVWENAFVIQGNSADELPEQILACTRMYRTEFREPRPFHSIMPAPSIGPGRATLSVVPESTGGPASGATSDSGQPNAASGTNENGDAQQQHQQQQ